MKKLTEYEVATLGWYNAERARGLLHSYDWKRDMEKLQIRFNTVQELEACGITVEEDGRMR
jgi:hypothetical protein